MSDHTPETEEQKIQRLAKQNMEIAQLSGSLAHEIKNPLSVIRMNMDLLAEDFETAETPRDRRALRKVSIVQSQCERLQNLLDDFLSFARSTRLELKPGNLNEQIEIVLDFVSPQLDAAGVEIVRHLNPDLPSVWMDSGKFQAALLNLVLNGQQAMPEGGQLWVRTRVTSGGVALDLIDTGCGMDDQTLLHIFDAFFTTRTGGSGLGLPTTKRIIEGHNGTISVHSEPNHGTQFTIELPVLPRLSAETEDLD